MQDDTRLTLLKYQCAQACTHGLWVHLLKIQPFKKCNHLYVPLWAKVSVWSSLLDWTLNPLLHDFLLKNLNLLFNWKLPYAHANVLSNCCHCFLWTQGFAPLWELLTALKKCNQNMIVPSNIEHHLDRSETSLGMDGPTGHQMEGLNPSLLYEK